MSPNGTAHLLSRPLLMRATDKVSVLEQRMVDWFPAAALFIFVAYHGLRDTIAAAVGMYGLVVYTLTGIAYFLLIAYWLCKGLKLSPRFVLLPLVIAVVFIFYIVAVGADDFIFEDYALPQAINPMGGIVAYFFLAAQNSSCRAETALKLSTVVMTIYLQSSLGSIMQNTTMAGYDMRLGFDALLFALLALHFLIDGEKKRALPSIIIWVLCAVSNIALILSYGSRGPLIGLVAFAALRFLVYVFGSSSSAMRKAVITVSVVGIAVMLVSSFSDIALAFNHQLNSMGISSRTLEKFLYADVASDSGRSHIWAALIPRISTLGNGPFSDQFFLGAGNYCHNFILEIFYDFGVPLGLVVLGLFMWLLVQSFRSCGVSPWFPLFLTLFSFCIGRLALSGTFWTETYFWGLLAVMGLCVMDLKGRASWSAPDCKDGTAKIENQHGFKAL